MPAHHTPQRPARGGGVKMEDTALQEPEFFIPHRLAVLEDGNRAMDGHFTVDAVTEVAGLAAADQLATLQGACHALNASESPTSIKDHDIFDTFYSFAKALPDGTVTRECRGLMASELSTALQKLSRQIARLCHQRHAANVDESTWSAVTVRARSSIRMLLLLVQHTISAPPRHRDGDGDGMSQTASQRPAGRGRRGRAGAAARGDDASTSDGIDISSKEIAMTAMVELLSPSCAPLWASAVGASGQPVGGVDENAATSMLKSALHLLGRHVTTPSGTRAADEDPVLEGVLHVLQHLAGRFTQAYDAALAAANSAQDNANPATPAPPRAAKPDPDGDAGGDTPAAADAADAALDGAASPGEAGRKSTRVAVSAAHPKNVLVSPLVELLLQTVPPTSAAATAPLPRFLCRLLGGIHAEATDEDAGDHYGIADPAAGGAAATAGDSTTGTPREAGAAATGDGNAMTRATSWNSRFVSWMLETVAQSAVNGELTGDGTAAKNVSALIEDLARNHISLIHAHAPMVMPILQSDNYDARKAAVTSIAELVLQKFKASIAAGPTQDAVMRDRYLEDVLARIRDLNPFVRSHTLKAWAGLVDGRAVPRHFHLRITREAVDRVVDRHYHVRRAALLLLEAILKRGQWFHSTISEQLFRARLVEHATALEAKYPSRDAFIAAVQRARGAAMLDEPNFVAVRTFQPPAQYAAAPPIPDDGADNANNDGTGGGVAGQADEQLNVEMSRVVFYQSAVDFAAVVGIALDAAVDMLASRTQQDVLQAIMFIGVASDLRLDKSAAAVAKMLTLVYFQEPQTQLAVCEAFVHIFFNSFNALKTTTANRNLARVQKLVSVIKGATDGEIAGVERILQHIRASASTQGAKPPPFAASLLGTVNDSFLDVVWGVIDGTLDQQATANEKRAALHLYLLFVNTILPRDVIHRKPALLGAMRANAVHPRICALALDALSREGTLRNFQPLDTSPNSGLATNPHGHAVLSAAAHQLARPTQHLNQWVSVASSAVSAIHVLCSHPAEVFASVIRHVADSVEKSLGIKAGSLPTAKIDVGKLPDDTIMLRIGQLCFLLGHSAIKQLVTVDTYERQQMKQLDDAASGKGRGDGANDARDAMQRELGIGGVEHERMQITDRAVAARTAIMNPKPKLVVDPAAIAAPPPRRSGRGSARPSAAVANVDMSATRLNVPAGLWGVLAPLVVRVCTAAPARAADRGGELDNATLTRAVAVTALLKLMVVSEPFCGQQLRLVFTMLSRPSESWQVKSNLVIGLGDVACVHPNTLAPFMKLSNSGFYALLADKDVRVRAVTIQVCTHLVLNDMLRVNDHLHAIVRLVSDPSESIRHNAQLFVQHLAVKLKHNLGNVIAPLVSALSFPSDAAANMGEADSQLTTASSPGAKKRSSRGGRKSDSVAVLPPLPFGEFQRAMTPLLETLTDAKAGEKERRAMEGLIDKLCSRFPPYTELDPHTAGLARNLAFCLSELNYATERNMKRLMAEACYTKYKQWLRDPEVLRLLQSIAAKTRRAVPSAASRAAAAAAGEQAAAGAERRDRATIEEWERRMAADAGLVVDDYNDGSGAPPAGDGNGGDEVADVVPVADDEEDGGGRRRQGLVDSSTDEDDDDGTAARRARRSGGSAAGAAAPAPARGRVKQEAPADDENSDDDDSGSDSSGSSSSSGDDSDDSDESDAPPQRGSRKRQQPTPKKQKSTGKATKSAPQPKKGAAKKVVKQEKGSGKKQQTGGKKRR